MSGASMVRPKSMMIMPKARYTGANRVMAASSEEMETDLEQLLDLLDQLLARTEDDHMVPRFDHGIVMGDDHLTMAGDRRPVVGLADNDCLVKVAHDGRHRDALRPGNLLDTPPHHLGGRGI